MRKFLGRSLAGAVLAAGLGVLPAAAQNKTLTISWWGFNGDKLEEIVLKPFRAQCGAG